MKEFNLLSTYYWNCNLKFQRLQTFIISGMNIHLFQFRKTQGVFPQSEVCNYFHLYIIGLVQSNPTVNALELGLSCIKSSISCQCYAGFERYERVIFPWHQWVQSFIKQKQTTNTKEWCCRQKCNSHFTITALASTTKNHIKEPSVMNNTRQCKYYFPKRPDLNE